MKLVLAVAFVACLFLVCLALAPVKNNFGVPIPAWGTRW